MAEISKKYFLDSEESDFLIVMVKPDFDIVSDDSYYDFVFSKIRSLFNSLLSSRHIFCYSAPSQTILHLLIQTNQVDFVESVCRKLLYEAQGFLYGQNGHLTIGFNDAPVEVKKLATGATYCRAALEERLLHGADHLYIVSALQKKQPFNENILAHTLTALKDNVYRSFDTNQLISKTQARELILNERPQIDRSLSGIEVAQLCNDIFGLLITCMRAHAVTSISELERENYLRKLHAQYTIEGRLEYLYSLYQDLFLEYGKLLYQKEKKPIRDAKLFIENHYPEQITLENVAEAVGFNTSYFSSLFKKETGLNFSDFLNQTRILHAKELLRDRANSAAAVADMVGFRDEKYFSKVFKKTVGLTIIDFRNLYY